MNTTAEQARGRRQFLLLVSVFAAPLVAAALFYYLMPQWQPDHTTNYGALVQPARPLPEAVSLAAVDGSAAGIDLFRGRWTLVQRAGSDCVDACAELLYLTRQVRATLNEKRDRVQRVLIVETPAAAVALQAELGELHPQLIILADPLQEFRGLVSDRDGAALYLLDPIGNWMMSYPAEVEPKGLQKDLKHLLKVSQIG